MELSNKGLGIIKSKLLERIKLHFVSEEKGIALKDFKRYEEIRAKNAKKRVLNALQSKRID